MKINNKKSELAMGKQIYFIQVQNDSVMHFKNFIHLLGILRDHLIFFSCLALYIGNLLQCWKCLQII